MPTLRFPEEMTVGLLEWSGSWKEHDGPVLARGEVDVPDGVRTTLHVKAIERLERVGEGVTVHRSNEPVDLRFLLDLPPDSIEVMQLHAGAVPGSWTALGHLHPGLRWLYLLRSELLDDALQAVARLTQVEYLQSFGNYFTDDGVQCLASLIELESLYLEEETLTAAAFRFVRQLPKLQRLGLQDVPITDAELDELRRELPGVRVDR